MASQQKTFKINLLLLFYHKTTIMTESAQPAPPDETSIIRKSISLLTNYNNKLSCDCMLHVDFAPGERIPESILQRTIIEIRTVDNTHPPTFWKLVDMHRFDMDKGIYYSIGTWASHGMDFFEFCQWMKTQKPDVNSETKMAVYMYRKCGEK